ncbi:MAG: ATP-binding protein [Pseudothermotoga sp.]|nr:ATP-binding protein [Pseudothermotoga sp.]
MKELFCFSFNANPLNVRVTRAAVRSFLLQRNIPEELVWDIEIAVNEALTNVIKHTYKYDQTKIIKMSISLDEKSVEIFIRDFGDHVDPKSLQPRIPDPEREGGFGLFIIHRVFDLVEFVNVHRGNLLRLSKSLRGRDV